MPSVSDKQHNAMEAAAHGHSTLGIPASVGKEFVEADKMAHHPHQSHSQHHHAKTKPDVNPGKKDWNTAGHHITDSTPVGRYRHHVHESRDKGLEHHPTLNHHMKDGV